MSGRDDKCPVCNIRPADNLLCSPCSRSLQKVEFTQMALIRWAAGRARRFAKAGATAQGGRGRPGNGWTAASTAFPAWNQDVLVTRGTSFFVAYRVPDAPGRSLGWWRLAGKQIPVNPDDHWQALPASPVCEAAGVTPEG